LIYNIGQTKFNNSPKLQDALKKHDWLNAAKQMDHGMNDPRNPGLKSRRLFEQNLFLK
jgi:GH24 family phage-related lysozyme (muramidase)